MEKSIQANIENYLTGITSDKYHRFKSWDHCFQAFSVSNQSDNHALELAFYLASWGMYRGSSGLLQKNHLIHQGTVDIIFSNASQKLKCHETREITKDDISAIVSVKKELEKHYNGIKFSKGTDAPKPISATDTLLSKIMLGTLGCVPAYDRYFIAGLKENNMLHIGFHEDSLYELLKFIDDYKSDIHQAQNYVKEKTNLHYPNMKILDMYFWQLGYDLSLS